MDTPPLTEWIHAVLRESNRQLSTSPKEQLFARCAARTGHMGPPADTLCGHTEDTVQMWGRLGLLYTGISLCVLTEGSGNTHERPPQREGRGPGHFNTGFPMS